MSSVTSRGICRICKSAEKNSYLAPCAHSNSCVECAERAGKCVQCNMPISTVHKLYRT